jgi:hypothetical protein
MDKMDGGVHVCSPKAGRSCGAGCGALFEHLAECHAGAEEAGAYGVHGQVQGAADFGIAELFKFAEKENLALDRVKLGDGAPDQKSGLGRVLLGGIRQRAAEESGAKRRFAAVGTQNFQGNRLQISSE